jgi:hypothetical protein
VTGTWPTSWWTTWTRDGPGNPCDDTVVVEESATRPGAVDGRVETGCDHWCEEDFPLDDVAGRCTSDRWLDCEDSCRVRTNGWIWNFWLCPRPKAVVVAWPLLASVERDAGRKMEGFLVRGSVPVRAVLLNNNHAYRLLLADEPLPLRRAEARTKRIAPTTPRTAPPKPAPTPTPIVIEAILLLL